jgi:hypothetical protein
MRSSQVVPAASGSMMLTSTTMQFIARLFAITICVALLGLLVIEAATIFRYGDGEAISILDAFNAPFVALASALGLGTLGHQLLSWLVTRITSSDVSSGPPDASSRVAGNGPGGEQSDRGPGI